VPVAPPPLGLSLLSKSERCWCPICPWRIVCGRLQWRFQERRAIGDNFIVKGEKEGEAAVADRVWTYRGTPSLSTFSTALYSIAPVVSGNSRQNLLRIKGVKVQPNKTKNNPCLACRKLSTYQISLKFEIRAKIHQKLFRV